MLPTKVKKHFKTVDPKLSSLFHLVLDCSFVPTKQYFRDLCESIVCQQLSGKAAASIWKRFLSLVGEQNITPEHVLKVEDTLLRRTGISWSKVTYTKSVAAAFLDGTVTPHMFTHMKDEQIVEQLIKIKGVGRWTAEMFLMFSLGREDIFAVGDLGLKKAVQKLYSMKTVPSETSMKRISKKWSPYRTYAARILWRSLETV